MFSFSGRGELAGLVSSDIPSNYTSPISENRSGVKHLGLVGLLEGSLGTLLTNLNS